MIGPLGKMVVIVPPPPPDDLWVCDYCNATITVRPIPVVESNALCAECFMRTVEVQIIRKVCSCRGCWGSITEIALVTEESPEKVANVLIEYLDGVGRPYGLRARS